MNISCSGCIFRNSGKFPKTAWRAVHSCQAAHEFLTCSRFLKGNRLAVSSRLLGDTKFSPNLLGFGWRAWRWRSNRQAARASWLDFRYSSILGWFWSLGNRGL